MSLAVLGRFELTVGGRLLPLRPGQETQLLKFVTVSGGRVHCEQAIEALWPEVARSAGRNRLRTVLNRLRAAAGTVLNREGDILVLDEGLQVDVQEFFSDAHRAQALASKDLALATAVARGAMARYRGDVLPDDRYDDWAEKPRQQAKLAMLELLDLCATEAARRGDLDALRRAVERTIEFAPYDDVRYLRAASALLEQGRRGEALAVVNRPGQRSPDSVSAHRVRCWNSSVRSSPDRLSSSGHAPGNGDNATWKSAYRAGAVRLPVLPGWPGIATVALAPRPGRYSQEHKRS